MGPGLFKDEPPGGRADGNRAEGRFRIDPADRPFAVSEPEREPAPWVEGDGGGFGVGVRRLGIALLFMAVAAGGLWYAYSKGKSAAAGGGEVPLIKADQTAMKVKPDNPGGIREDGDAPVYNVGAASGGKVEQLLPAPEEPMAKPQPDVVPPPPPPAAAPVATAPAAAPAAPPVVAEPPPSPPVALPSPIAAAPPVTQEAPPPPVTPPEQVPPKATTEAVPKQIAVAGGGPVRIQIAATRDIASAHQEWNRMKAAHHDVLGDLKAFGVRVDLGAKGTFYRIQAGPIATRADALRRCAVLRQSRIGCIIVKQP